MKPLPTVQVVAGLSSILGGGATLAAVCLALWLTGDGVPRGIVGAGVFGAGLSVGAALALAGRFARRGEQRLDSLAADIERHKADNLELPVLVDGSDSVAMTRLVRSVESLWTAAAEQIRDRKSVV